MKNDKGNGGRYETLFETQQFVKTHNESNDTKVDPASSGVVRQRFDKLFSAVSASTIDDFRASSKASSNPNDDFKASSNPNEAAFQFHIIEGPLDANANYIYVKDKLLVKLLPTYTARKWRVSGQSEKDEVVHRYDSS